MTFAKFCLGFAVHTLTLLVVATALAFWWGAQEFARPGPLTAPATIEIPRGAGVMGIAESLKSAGALNNPYIFVFGARLLGAQSDLKAGEYEIAAGASPRAILEQMRRGDTIKRRVTLREGLTSYEIDALLADVPDIRLVRTEHSMEGSLLPGTYDYKTTDTNADILNRMSAAMTKTLEELWAARDPNLPLATPQDALTLASIVEKETGVASERARIAGVFVNRLQQGMPLQTDPTVIYALTGGKPKNNGQGPLGRRLLSKDLEIDSPYNTYKNAGLPPGPICNPGREAIAATLKPETHSYLYFVADGTGGHVFATTLAAHEKNVANWREVRRQDKAEPEPVKPGTVKPDIAKP